jgi:hypothetical protein
MSARRSAVLLVVATVLAGCGGGDGDGNGDADRDRQTTRDGTTTRAEEPEPTTCAVRLRWKGKEYLGSEVRLPAQRGEELGKATIPACGPYQRRDIRIARIRGVDPTVAVGSADDAFVVFVAEAALGQDFPEALQRILYGVSCRPNRPFTLAGRLVAISAPDRPLYIQLDVDSSPEEAAYDGVRITLAVRDATEGLNSRDALLADRLGRARLQARVRCVEADRPDRTFLAESIETVGGG